MHDKEKSRKYHVMQQTLKNLMVSIMIGLLILTSSFLLLSGFQNYQVSTSIEDLTNDNQDSQEQPTEPEDPIDNNDLTNDNPDAQEQPAEPEEPLDNNDVTNDNPDAQEQPAEPEEPSSNSNWRIPSTLEWVERATIILPGPEGSWDARLDGMITPCSVIKKDGTYFLYYLGADGDRSTDGGPRHRALGVATSIDGIHFTKYSGNPVLTHLPNNNEEEGIFSVAALLDLNGDVVIYYGAMDAGSSTSEYVDGDIRLAVSKDGYNFQEIGDVVSHSDSSIWGYGDELFPTGAIHVDDKWVVYYVAKGENDIYWDIGAIWGTSKNNLETSREVLSYSTKIGSCVPILVKPNMISLFFSIMPDTTSNSIEVRNAPVYSPNEPSSIIQEYQFSELEHGTIFLDKERNMWFFYYLTNAGNRIDVKTARASAN